jgi:hypothetical protein
MQDPKKPPPYSDYVPGQFAEPAREPFAAEAWAFLARPDNLHAMLDLAGRERPPMEAVGVELQRLFGEAIEQSRFPNDLLHTMVNNMMKQLMERHGYEHVACALVPGCPFCTRSGVYRKIA